MFSFSNFKLKFLYVLQIYSTTFQHKSGMFFIFNENFQNVINISATIEARESKNSIFK